MTLLAPISLQLIGITAAVLGGLLVIAYVLKMRRRRFEVPFSTLWHRVLKEKEANSLWKHLKRLLSLLLVAAMIGAAVFAATEPRLGAADRDARNVVIIVDSSASMKTVDEGSDGTRARWVVARDKVEELLDAMGSGDAAMLVRMDGQTTPLSRFETDKAALKRLLKTVNPSDTPADLRRALTAAADALHERQNPLIVVVGDGAYPQAVLDSVRLATGDKAEPEKAPAAPAAAQPADAETRGAPKKLAEIDLRGIDLRFIGVGKKSENAGIVAFNVRRYIADKLNYEVFIEVQNFGAEAIRRKLVLYNGADAIDVKEIALKPGERRREIYTELGGGSDHRLRAVLQAPDAEGSAPTGDAFALDDVAHALLPERKKQRVLLVTADNLYLEGAMLVYDNITVDKLLPAEYEAQINELPAYHAVVFDDYTPKAVPPERTHLAFFNPSPKDENDNAPFEIAGTVGNRPKVTSTNEDHPVMRWITMSDVNFDEVTVYKYDRQAREVPLINSARATIAVAKREGRRKIVAFGWSLRGTDLMLRVGFPLLLVNVLDWFAGDDSDLITTYTTGRRVRVPLDGTVDINEAELRHPNDRLAKAPITDSHATFYASQVGVYTMTAKRDGEVVASIQLAANLSNPEESAIAPRADLVVDSVKLEAPEGFEITRRTSIWLYLALLVLLLLGIEWLTYNRRITV
jgi:hypothetical protein